MEIKKKFKNYTKNKELDILQNEIYKEIPHLCPSQAEKYRN